MTGSSSSRRRKIRRGEDRLSVEMILRRSFVDSVKDYAHNCSIAGARQICDPKIGLFQRVLWILVFCAAFGTECYFLQYVWTSSLNKPLIVTLETTDYAIGDMHFPAVAICNNNRISKKALAKFAMEEFHTLAEHESLEEVEAMLLQLGRLIDYSYNGTLRRHPLFRRMVDKYRLDNQRIVNIMKMLAPKCNEMLMRCSWEGEQVDCDRLFRVKRTANRGHCCTFNSWLSFETPVGSSKTIKIDEVKRQHSPGFEQGLNLVLDPLIDDYAYPLSNIQGFDVLLFDALHFADPSAGRVIHQIVEPNGLVFLELKSTKQIASKEIRKYNVETRKCLFHDERSKIFSDMYSYSSCIVFCRIQTIQSLCKCTPYFFAATKDHGEAPVCTLEDLPCLNKYKEKLYYLYPTNAEDTRGLEMEMTDSLTCTECLPDCELVQHNAKFFEANFELFTFKEKTLLNSFYQDINISGKSFLSVYYPTRDSTLVRLDVVSYWYEILSNIGGFCSIVEGFSFISIVEILYYFTIRFAWILRGNYRKYR